jgi:hypothetical protein
MSMNLFESVVSCLKSMTYTKMVALAETAGVPESTVRKLKYDQSINPTSRTIEALACALIAEGLLKATISKQKIPLFVAYCKK